MTPLDRAISAAPSPELKATRALIHRAGGARARLGWPDGLPEWPTLLEAFCLAMSAELVTRGDRFGACYPCEASLGPSGQPSSDGAALTSRAGVAAVVAGEGAQ